MLYLYTIKIQCSSNKSREVNETFLKLYLIYLVVTLTMKNQVNILMKWERVILDPQVKSNKIINFMIDILILFHYIQ